MKVKKYLLCMGLLLLGLEAWTQAAFIPKHKAKRWFWGPSAHFSLQKLGYREAPTSNSSYDVKYFNVETNIEPGLGLGGELSFLSRGWGFRMETGVQTRKLETTYRYVWIPATNGEPITDEDVMQESSYLEVFASPQLAVYAGEQKRWVLTIGPQIAKPFAKKYRKIRVSNLPLRGTPYEQKYYVYDGPIWVDPTFGWTLGISRWVPLKKRHLALRMEYYRGVDDFDQSPFLRRHHLRFGASWLL